MGSDAEIQADSERIRPANSEVNRLFGDNSLLMDLTNWSPKYGGIDGFKQGLRETAEWFSNPKNLAKYSPETYAI